MSVFVCASDESADQNPRGNFFYAGFAAPVDDWNGPFTQAWQERVLKGPPEIPYLHVTEIRDSAWRAEYGLRENDADQRLDEATRVIRSMGSLIPVAVFVDEADYNRLVRQKFHPKPGQVAELEPDYICYIYFTLTQLHQIHGAAPDVERVHFWVEQKKPVTRHLQGFHDEAASALTDIDLPELAPLVGDLVPVGKTCIPAQAADLLGWHARRAKQGTLDSTGRIRYARMIDGGYGGSRSRPGFYGPISEETLEALGAGFSRRLREAAAAEASNLMEENCILRAHLRGRVR